MTLRMLCLPWPSSITRQAKIMNKLAPVISAQLFIVWVSSNLITLFLFYFHHKWFFILLYSPFVFSLYVSFFGWMHKNFVKLEATPLKKMAVPHFTMTFIWVEPQLDGVKMLLVVCPTPSFSIMRVTNVGSHFFSNTIFSVI